MDTPLAERILQFAHSDYALKWGLVLAYSPDGRPSPVKSQDELDYKMKQGLTVQVLGLENFNLKFYQICEHLRSTYDHIGPITASVYFSGSYEAGWMVDPEGTWLKVLSGVKQVQFENGANVTKVELVFDQDIYISPLTRYRTISKKPSTLLCVKLGRFIEDELADVR